MADTVAPAAIQKKKVGGLYVQHLGPLEASPLLLVIGRNNFRKKSALISALATQLHAHGLSVCWYEHRGNLHARLREQAWADIKARWLDTLMQRHPTWGAWAQRAVQLCLRTRYPERRFWESRPITPAHVPTTADLRRFVRRLKVPQIFVLSHSAGGVVASMIAAEPAIQKIICFGYPFKHPDQPEEPYRTAHLATLAKPLLIIQGDQDEYGSPQDANRYALSPVIQILPIESDHDYDGLPKAEFQQLCEQVATFLGVPAPSTQAGRAPMLSSEKQSAERVHAKEHSHEEVSLRIHGGAPRNGSLDGAA
ncbi:MAG TPA: alpha/beta family hydrolase [Aquabacterium sp.]|nr:alpha/beta family hydrolase [Aquabacterium sp.]